MIVVVVFCSHGAVAVVVVGIVVALSPVVVVVAVLWTALLGRGLQREEGSAPIRGGGREFLRDSPRSTAGCSPGCVVATKYRNSASSSRWRETLEVLG